MLVVESPGSCHDGAGLIPAACMALLPKRRRGEGEGSECAAAADLRAARATGAARGRWCVFSGSQGAGVVFKKAARRTYRGLAVPVA